MEKTLKNINILLTRTRNQSVDTIKKFEELGANVLSFPTIQILTINSSRLDNEIKKLNEYNTLIFTSEDAVRSLLKKIKDLNIDFDPEAFFVISIGEKTSQVCKHFGFRVDLQSNIATSGNLTKELSYMDLVGRRILIPSSNLSNPKQFDPLEDQGAVINSLPVYENKVNDMKNLEAELKRLEIWKLISIYSPALQHLTDFSKFWIFKILKNILKKSILL